MKKHILLQQHSQHYFLTSCNKEKTTTDSTPASVDSVASKPADSAAVSGTQDEI